MRKHITMLVMVLFCFAAVAHAEMGGAIQGRDLNMTNANSLVTTLAGTVGVSSSTDGTGIGAKFYGPWYITTDGSNLYVADGYTVRKVVIATGQVTTLAGTAGLSGSTEGTGSAARFAYAYGITTDGTNLYVVDLSNYNIRKVVIATGEVTTLAGAAGVSGYADGIGTAARFKYPYGITTDGTNLYVADTYNGTVRKIVIATREVTTLAGTAGVGGSTDGTGSAAKFCGPEALTTDGTYLYVSDSCNHIIRKIVIATRVVTTLAGTADVTGSTDGTGAAAKFKWPRGMTMDGANLYVTDNNNATIRKIVIATGEVTTLAGSAGVTGYTDGIGSVARFNMPYGITTDGTNLYVADQGNYTIRKISAQSLDGQCGTAAGKPFIAAPVADLCVSGTASAVTKGDSWSWNCNGLNGGSSTSCSAVIVSAQQSSATAVTDMVWQNIGPFGANTYCFTIDPTNSQTIYAGTYAGGVYKSMNGGASWRPANNGMAPGTGVKGIVLDPSNTQILYAGSKSGVFKTTDGGESWTGLNNGLTTTQDKDINVLTMDPTNSQIMYIGTQGSGVLKTTDGGNSWVAITSGLVPATGDYYVYALAIDPANPQIIYAGTGTTSGGKVFKTVNGGAVWSVTGNGISMGRVYDLVIDPSNRSILYAGTMNKGIYQTTDGAATWTQLTNGNALSTASILQMAIDKTTGQTIYAGAYLQGIYKSTDRGASWTQVNNGLIKTSVYAIAIDPANVQTLYAGTYAGGVFKSINGGQSWSPVGDGLTNAYMFTLALDPVSAQTIYAGTQFNLLFKTTDAGTSWAAIDNSPNYFQTQTTPTTDYGNSASFIAVDPSNRQTVYASIYNATTLTYKLYKSTDGGTTWAAANGGLSSRVFSLAIDPFNSQTLYAGTMVGVFKSLNGGTTWVAANSGLTDLNIYSLAMDRSNNQLIYAGTYYGKIFKSSNGGGVWSSVSSGLPGKWIRALVINPSNSQSIYAGLYDGGGVYRTSDGGASWNAVINGLTNLNVTSLVIDPTNTQIIYAGTDGGGVFRTFNGGISWSAMNTNLYDLYVRSLAIDPMNNKLVYAGTWGSGVYKTLTSDDIPVLSGANTPTFTEGTPVNFQIASSGWPAPVFSLSGTLPGGLTFDSATGAISGTPNSGTTGTYPLIITATNGIPPDAVRGVTLTILPASSLAASILSPAKGSVLPSLIGISGTASGTGISKVELQVTDGIYYLQSSGTFATTSAWLTAASTTSWTLTTTSVTWREGITYTIQVRASNGSAVSAPSSSTFTIQIPTSKTNTTISIIIPETLRAGDGTTISGSLVKLDTSAATGQPVTLVITPPSTAAAPNPAPIITSLTTDSSGAFTSGALSLFAVPGVYTVQARFEGTSTLASSFTSQTLGVTPQSGYAIIVTGKAPDNSLLDMHTASTGAIYFTLVNKRGFLPENITYLKSTTSTPVTRQQLQDTLTVWAKNKLIASPAPLYLIMIDHGSTTGFLMDTDTLTPDQLKGYLDNLESDPQVISSGTLATHNRIIMVGSCYSGIFAKLSKPGRVVITSANFDEQSIAGFSIYNSGSNTTYYGGEYFIDALFSYLGRGDTLKDAFTQSSNMVELRDPRKVPPGTHAGVNDTLAQHPLLDDNGDNKASYVLDTDGALAANLRLGVGKRSIGNPADITAVTGTTIIPSTQAGETPLWLQVNDNSRIAKAWMEIRTPITTFTTSTTGQVIPHLITLPLYYDGIQWNGSYTFPNAGKYNILYYTQDNETNDIAPAKHSVVYRQLTDNPAPAGFNLTSPNNGEALSGMFTLTWQEVEVKSPNKITYTLRVATDQNFVNEVYKEENIPQAATYMPRDALKNPQTGQYYCPNGDSLCYWKVQAIDSYGATTESDTRSFTIISTNALPGIIKGIIYSDLDYSRITTASLTATIGGSNINIPVTNGVFFLAANSGNVAITGTAQGYQDVASDVNVQAGEVTTLNIGMAAFIAVIKGDIDGQNGVTIADAILALQSMSRQSPSGIRASYATSGADVNGDGKIGMAEVIYILQKVAGIR